MANTNYPIKDGSNASRTVLSKVVGSDILPIHQVVNADGSDFLGALDATIVSSNTKLDTLHTDSAAILSKLNATIAIGTLPALVAGTALVGKVGIDQTTPGTTNKVSIGNDGIVALTTGSALVGKFGIDQTTPGTTNKVSIGTDGTVAINAAIPAGTALIGKVGIDQTTPGTTNKVSIGTDGTVTLASGTNLAGKFGIDQTTPGTTNGVVINASALPTGASTAALQTTGNTSLASILTACTAATPAGSAIIGKVGIDQTTPGTTNGVVINNTSSVPVQTISPLPASIVVGQVIIATTGTRVQLPSNALLNGVVVKSKSSNNATGQTIGGSTVTATVDGTGNGYLMAPGEAASFGVSNTNVLYVNGTVGDIFTYEGN